jgi:glycosyltransferase involved in cell wall biosynthesis
MSGALGASGLQGFGTKVYINARLQGRRVTGVERFSGEIASRLLPLIARDSRFRVQVIAPGNATAAGFENIRPRALPPALSVLWEQLVLPMRARNGFLVNLSNTGPLAVRRQLVVVCDASVFAMPDNYSFVFRIWYRIALKSLLRRAARVITISDFSRTELARYCGVPEKRIDVVPCGSDHIDAIHADNGFPRRAGLVPGRYVLAVGTPSRAKNFAALGQAMARLEGTDLRLVLAGNLEPSVFRAHGIELPRSTRLLGYVSDSELKALYEQALCFAFPSRYEGFGLPPLEAMRCGCPVIVSNAASLPEVCGAAALFVDPDDTLALTEHVRALADSESLRKHFRALGLAHARRYTWDASSERLFELIAAAAGAAA